MLWSVEGLPWKMGYVLRQGLQMIHHCSVSYSLGKEETLRTGYEK